MSDEGNTVDALLLQYCKAVIGIFRVLRATVSIHFTGTVNSRSSTAFICAASAEPWSAGSPPVANIGLPGLLMQPGAYRTRSRLEASHSIAVILRGVIVGAAPSTTMAWMSLSRELRRGAGSNVRSSASATSGMDSR